MTIDITRLPKGWQPMAQELVDKAQRQFRGIVFTNISAHPGGWLSIDFDKHSVPVEHNWHALKMCEGYSSMSWHICTQCGSHHADQRPSHAMPICEDCVK